MPSVRDPYLSFSEVGVNGSINKMYEIPGPKTTNNQSFVLVRRPERSFNVSRDNLLAQRDLKKAGVDVRDWYHEKAPGIRTGSGNTK